MKKEILLEVAPRPVRDEEKPVVIEYTGTINEVNKLLNAARTAGADVQAFPESLADKVNIFKTTFSINQNQFGKFIKIFTEKPE